MADIVCVEPAVSFQRSVVSAGGNDTLVFPHVDSCIAVIFFVGADTLVGGHAGVWDDASQDLNASASLDAILLRMHQLAGNRSISRVVFAGSTSEPGDPGYDISSDWLLAPKIAALRTNKPNLSVATIKTNEQRGGVDVFADLGTLKLSIQPYALDRTRADIGPPRRTTPVYDVPFHAVRNHALT